MNSFRFQKRDNDAVTEAAATKGNAMIEQQHRLSPTQTSTLPTGRMLRQLGSDKQTWEIDFAPFERFANAVATHKAAASLALFELVHRTDSSL